MVTGWAKLDRLFPAAFILLLAVGPLDGAQRSVTLADDPSQDGWSTEVLQSLAAEQLSQVAKHLTGPVGLDRLRRLVAEEFVCSQLRPARLTRTFSDPVLTVFRPESESPTPSAFEGVDGLARALHQLSTEDATDSRAKFKIFRIQLNDDGFETRQFLRMFSKTAVGRREINAVWLCRWLQSRADEVPRLRSIAVEDYEEVVAQSRPSALFTDCTESVLGGNLSFHKQLLPGLDHWSDRLLRVGTDGMQGLAVGDVNGDGLDDVYICQISPLPNRLYVQNSDGTATDRSAAAGVDWHEPSHSAVFIDLDNDGDQDLLISTRAALLVMENDGSGAFALRIRIAAARNAYSLTAADYDQDGDLDVFACVYLAKARSREILAAPVPFHDARNGGRNVLLRNDGAWKLRDATRQAGLETEATRRSFAASWEDYDNDGDPDLYVANDYGRNNLFRNDAGRFTNVAKAAGVEDQSFGMSVSWSDFDRDGWMDLYVANMFSAAGNRIAFQRQFRANDSDSARSKFQYMARGNSLFQNAGDGTFRDVSLRAAINVADWSWDSRFVDLNNDGYEDILVANGFLTRRDPHDL